MPRVLNLPVVPGPLEHQGSNALLPDVRKMNLRIGVNLGDVMVVGENLLGDGVNVAARLEGMADAGGICISGDVYNQVKQKLAVSFENMGPQRLKNISEPVPVFRIVPGASVKRLEVGTSRLALRRWRTLAMAVALIAGFTVAFAALWKNVFAPETALHDMVSERPSIAVLHFKNLTGDKSHDYFSEGVSETIMTQLTKVPGIAVVSHTSSSSYEDEHVEPQEVGRQLGVRYVLEGGVQISGERRRITAKLIEASTGKHVWAESYDQKAEDIFLVQDDITLNIVKTLGVELAPKERAALTRRHDNAPNSMNPSGAQERTMMRRMRQDDAKKPPATGSSTRPRSQM